MEYNCEMIGDERNENRYVLENKGKNQLIVIGLNPSTASDLEPDNTMRRIMGYAQNNGFDGFIMINLYPQRSTNPKNLNSQLNEQIHKINLGHIENMILNIQKEYPTIQPTILLGFGNNIERRPYLKKCFKDIVDKLQEANPKWKCISLTKKGHPGHPLYLAKDKGFEEFNIDEYIKKISL